MISRKILPLALGLLLLLQSPAAAAQLDAKDAPKLNGPLTTTPGLRSCTRQTERTDGGQVIAYFKVCTRYYEFDPDKENDSDSNYGAFWIQANINASNGWCARSAKIDLTYSGGVRNKAPKPGTTERAKHRERFTTKLIVDTDGHSTGDASIKNSFSLLPGKLRASRPRSGKFRLEWRGKTANKLALVSGLELSWPQGGNAPAIQPSVGAVFDRNCG